jgi:hypothetical protein
MFAMTDSPPRIRLRLHRYAGREQGLMIIATRESMERLVMQIRDGLATDVGRPTDWPKRVAACEAVGLDNTETPIDLSFHLDTDPPFRQRSANPAFGSIWSLGVTVAGAAALVVLILEHMR